MLLQRQHRTRTNPIWGAAKSELKQGEKAVSWRLVVTWVSDLQWPTVMDSRLFTQHGVEDGEQG